MIAHQQYEHGSRRFFRHQDEERKCHSHRHSYHTTRLHNDETVIR